MKKEFDSIKILDVVATLKAFPEHRILKGEVGTVVEQLDEEMFEVEFSNKKGHTVYMVSLHAQDLMLLHFQGELT